MMCDRLGTVSLKNGRPIDYSSKTLAVCEQKYAQIDEILAVVYTL